MKYIYVEHESNLPPLCSIHKQIPLPAPQHLLPTGPESQSASFQGSSTLLLLVTEQVEALLPNPMIALKMLLEMLTPEQTFSTVVLVAQRTGNGPALAGFTLNVTLQTIDPGERFSHLRIAKTVEGGLSIVGGDPVLDHLHLLLCLVLALVCGGGKVDVVEIDLWDYRDRITHQPWIVESSGEELHRSRPQRGVGLRVSEEVERGVWDHGRACQATNRQTLHRAQRSGQRAASEFFCLRHGQQKKTKSASPSWEAGVHWPNGQSHSANQPVGSC